MRKKMNIVTHYLTEHAGDSDIRYNGRQFYLYDPRTRFWQTRTDSEAGRYLYNALGARATVSDVKNILAAIRLDARFDFPAVSTASRACVLANNGRVNLANGQLEAVAKSDFEHRHVNFDFIADAKWTQAPAFVRYVKSSLDVDLQKPLAVCANKEKERRSLLVQILGYAISELYGAKKMVVLIGPSNAGKTVILNLLRFVIGEGSYTPISLDDLSNRFRSSLLLDTSMVINDELASKGLRNLDMLKKIISGEPIIVEKKGIQPEIYTPHVKCVFAANALPSLKEYDGQNAFSERLQLLTFPHSVARDDWDIELTSKLIEERHAIFSCVIHELGDFAKTLKFADDPDAETVAADYRRSTTSVLTFIDECCVRQSETYTVLSDFYQSYCNFCDDECLDALSKPDFRAQLRQLGYEFRKKRPYSTANPMSSVMGLAIKNTGEV
jgi:P4 family phage/plasmid primase-like protien